jgi:LysM repeat protein
MSKQCLGPCAILAFLLAPALFWAEDLVHTLKKGETLYSISRQYQVPAELIMSHNGIANPDRLQAGQKIKIPGIYTVQKGDTLYAIARKFGVTADELARINKIPKDGTLKAGDRLCVPGGARPSPRREGNDPAPAKGDDAGQKLRRGSPVPSIPEHTTTAPSTSP